MRMFKLIERSRSKLIERSRRTAAVVMTLGCMQAAGCVNVNAPDKPIEINLNINVTQEVVYRLDGQAKSLIQSNPGIF